MVFRDLILVLELGKRLSLHQCSVSCSFQQSTTTSIKPLVLAAISFSPALYHKVAVRIGYRLVDISEQKLRVLLAYS